MTEEINNQEEVLEQTEQEQELVEAPEQVAEETVEEEKIEEIQIPSTKTAMIKQLFDKVNGLKKEEVSKRFKELIDVIEAEDMGGEDPMTADPEGDKVAVGKKKKKMKVAMPEINVKEDIAALVQGEELSEEFKSKAATIFEAAVHQKVMEVSSEKVDELEKEYQENLQEEIVSFRDELTDKVDRSLGTIYNHNFDIPFLDQQIKELYNFDNEITKPIIIAKGKSKIIDFDVLRNNNSNIIFTSNLPSTTYCRSLTNSLPIITRTKTTKKPIR